MTQLLLIILDDTSRLPDLLKAWEKIGVPGATILSSIGAHRARNWLNRMGLESLDRLFEAKEVRKKTLLAAIDDEELLDQAIAEAERVMGGFDRSHSGLMLVLPVTFARGMRRATGEGEVKKKRPPVLPGWSHLRHTPIEEVDIVLNLAPTLVSPDTPLDEVVPKMLPQSNVHVACVVDEDKRLIGLLKLRALADDLFFHILPEEFISEITDLEQAMSFAKKSKTRTAGDAMEEAVWVKKDETVKDAFKRMHDNDLPGLPVVDDCYRVCGYINLLELLALCLKDKGKTGKQEAA